MLNTDPSSRVNSLANAKSVLVDTSWEKYGEKLWFGGAGKLVSLFKQEADAILNEGQVLEGYYHSAKRGIFKLDEELVQEKANEVAAKLDFTSREDPMLTEIYRKDFIENQIEQDNVFSFISDKNKEMT